MQFYFISGPGQSKTSMRFHSDSDNYANYSRWNSRNTHGVIRLIVYSGHKSVSLRICKLIRDRAFLYVL